MKNLTTSLAVTLLVAPVLSLAQTNDTRPLTRAEVKQHLIELEQAGYNPATESDWKYPANLQAAENRVQARNDAIAQTHGDGAETSGYGAATSGAAQSGGTRTTSSGY